MSCRRTVVALVGLLVAACSSGTGPGPPIRTLTAADDGPVGFAASTTGGAGRPTVTVTTLADSGPGSLRDALAAGGNIGFTAGLAGTIHAGSPLDVPSDTTVDGTGATVTISGNGMATAGRNVIIRRLRFAAIDATDTSDAVWVHDGASLVWVDHNTFSMPITDGSVDVTRQATDVELSANHFIGTAKTDLLGHASPDGTPPLVDMTVRDNWYDHAGERTPKMRHGRFDVFHNVVEDWGYLGTTGGSGNGMDSSCGALAYIHDNAFISSGNPKAFITTPTGCDPTRPPAALMGDNLAVNVAPPVSVLPDLVTWPQTVTLPQAAPMTADLAAAIKAAAGADAPTGPPPTTTTVPPSTTGASTTTTRPVTTTTAGNVPQNVTVTRTGPSSLTISWAAVTGATSYKWRLYACAGTKLDDGSTGQTSTPRTALGPGCYYATVQANVGGILGPVGQSGQVTLP